MQEFEKKLNEADERVSNQLAKNASDLASRIGDKYSRLVDSRGRKGIDLKLDIQIN